MTRLFHRRRNHTCFRAVIMRKNIITFFILGILINSGLSAQETPIRLGWQIPWATQGQLVMGLKHTNIQQLVGSNVEFTGFSYGGPLNRAALSGEVDVLLTADQPALVLLTRNPDFQIVSRMMYNRVCVYVPPTSKISSLADLGGKSIMGPVGAAAERVAMAGIAREGVDISSMRSGKLDMAQQAALIAGVESGQDWGEIHALYGFDPMPAVFEEQGKARILHCDKVVSVVVATRDMIENRTEELRAFLKGFILSWINFANNPVEMNEKFSTDSRLNVSQEVLDSAASIEPNRWVQRVSKMSFEFSESDYEVFNQTNDFLLSREIIDKAVDMNAAIDLSLVQQVLSGADISSLSKQIQPN